MSGRTAREETEEEVPRPGGVLGRAHVAAAHRGAAESELTPPHGDGPADCRRAAASLRRMPPPSRGSAPAPDPARRPRHGPVPAHRPVAVDEALRGSTSRPIAWRSEGRHRRWIEVTPTTGVRSSGSRRSIVGPRSPTQNPGWSTTARPSGETPNSTRRVTAWQSRSGGCIAMTNQMGGWDVSGPAPRRSLGLDRCRTQLAGEGRTQRGGSPVESRPGRHADQPDRPDGAGGVDLQRGEISSVAHRLTGPSNRSVRPPGLSHVPPRCGTCSAIPRGPDPIARRPIA